MTTEEFRTLMKEKGWTPTTLAKHWGFKSDSRIHQIARDPHKNPYFVDAIRGLPYINKV